MASAENDQTNDRDRHPTSGALFATAAPSLRSVSSITVQGLVDRISDFGAAQGKTWQPTDAQADGGTTRREVQGAFYESRVGTDMRAATARRSSAAASTTTPLSVMQQGMSDATVDKAPRALRRDAGVREQHQRGGRREWRSLHRRARVQARRQEPAHRALPPDAELAPHDEGGW